MESDMSFRKSVLAALTAAGLAGALAAPSYAATVTLAPRLNPTPQAEPATERIDYRRGYKKRGHHGKRQYPYYNGRRGYRTYRHGYRRHHGWWFPPAAFSYRYRYVPPQRSIYPPPLVLTPPPAVIQPPAHVFVPPPPAAYLSPAHYQWCDRRYRSYRAADNSFQPYHGPRRACISPYGP
jgi:hypothetical protein